MDLLACIAFRPFRADDYNYVLSTWAKSFRFSAWAGTTRNDLYHKVMKYTFDSLRQRGMIVQMACSDEDDTQLLGYIAYEKAANGAYVVHYVFVKNDFRRLGVMKALINDIGLPKRFLYTHRTADSPKLKGGEHVALLARRKDLEPVR